MKRLVVLAGCVVLVAASVGCRNGAKGNNGVRVAVEGGGRFPKSLAGTWKNEKTGWEFVFERDGTISSAVIENGLLRVTPGQKTIRVDTGKGHCVYDMGPCGATYSPQTRELSVSVAIDHYILQTKSLGIEGSSSDYFVGPVSKDCQTWTADWYSFPSARAFAENEQDLVFEQDMNDVPATTIVFRRQ